MEEMNQCDDISVLFSHIFSQMNLSDDEFEDDMFSLISDDDQFDDEFSPDFFDFMEFMVGADAGMHFAETRGHHTSSGRATSPVKSDQPQNRRHYSRSKPTKGARQRKKMRQKAAVANEPTPFNTDLREKAAVVSPKLKIGTPVLVYGKTPGIVRFVGPTAYAQRDFVGVELAEPTGKNNGTVKGVTYFKCPPRHGIMVRPSDIQAA